MTGKVISKTHKTMILTIALLAKDFFYCKGIWYNTVLKQTDIDLRSSNKKNRLITLLGIL